MTINIKATNLELTRSIERYIHRRFSAINKFAKGEDVVGYIEVAKTTNHHNQGEVFRAEFDVRFGETKFYTSAEKEDLYSAIDKAQEEIVRRISENKDKKQTLYRRGAKSIKKMFKGLSSRNPFTGKY